MSKHFISNRLRSIALLSLTLALASAALVAPAPAAAATCNPIGTMPTPCGVTYVYVVDANSGRPITNATITLVDVDGNRTVAQSVDDVGTYNAYVTVGTYKVMVSAPLYQDFVTSTEVRPQESNVVKAPLMPNARDVPVKSISIKSASVRD